MAFLSGNFNAMSGFGYIAGVNRNATPGVSTKPATAQSTKSLEAIIAPNISTKVNFVKPPDTRRESIAGAVKAGQEMKGTVAAVKQCAQQIAGEIMAVAKANKIDLAKTMGPMPTAPNSPVEFAGLPVVTKAAGGGSAATFLTPANHLSTLGTLSEEGGATSGIDQQAVTDLNAALTANSPANWQHDAVMKVQDPNAPQLLARALSFDAEELLALPNAVEHIFALAYGDNMEGFPELKALSDAIAVCDEYVQNNAPQLAKAEPIKAVFHSSVVDAMGTCDLTRQASVIFAGINNMDARAFALRPGHNHLVEAMFKDAGLDQSAKAPAAHANFNNEPKIQTPVSV